ncbi:MAG: histidine phosphatase family protein [Bacteroidota bacterium]
MKTLIFVRHAKSSWADPSLQDHDRPLNNRGKRDAPVMGQLLHGRGIMPDLMITSSAKRARRTAKVIAKELGYPKEDLKIVPAIYGAFAQDILELIKMLDDELNCVMVFGHNPEFTSLANYFSTEYIDNVPTCGIVTIQVGCEHWKDVDNGNSKLIAFDYPKKFQ